MDIAWFKVMKPRMIYWIVLELLEKVQVLDGKFVESMKRLRIILLYENVR